MNAQALIEAIPEIETVASLTTEDFSRVGSSRMTPEMQFQLSRRIRELEDKEPDIAGFVITHGTDSLEETAFFLDLTASAEAPIVFAAAQRPPRLIDTDGPRNLLNAIRVAASSATREMGVLVTLNDEIHAARDVRKTHTIAVQTFASPWSGPVGYIDDGSVYLMHQPLRRLNLKVESVEPRVELIRLVVGSDGRDIDDAVKRDAQGIVVEVFGRGNAPPKVMEAVARARAASRTVVFVSRTGGGRVRLSAKQSELGIISGEDLDGLKARIVLTVALGGTRGTPGRETLSGYFRTLAGKTEPVTSKQ